MNIIKAKSDEMKWGIELGALARIWKVSLRLSVKPLGHTQLTAGAFK